MAIAQFSGLASGIDSGALIDAVIEAKQRRNEIRKKQIEDIDAESDSLLEFKSKVSALSDLIDKFRTSNGGGISKKASSSDSAVVTASASASAINASYALTVTSIADSANGSFDHSYSSSSTAMSAAGGDVTVTIGTGASQTIITTAVTAGVTTLDSFVTAFNADTNAAGKVIASSINIGTEAAPDYRLMFTTVESGTVEGSLSLGSTTAELTTSTVSQATDAVFTLGGIGTAITRSTNTISDVISGVSFTLSDTGSSTVTVTNDADSTLADVQEFVEAYNEIVKYLNENNTVERVESGESATNVFASLSKTGVDNDFISAFRGYISSASSTSGTSVTSLSELGIQTNRDGTLTINEDNFNEATFKEAIQNDPIGATEVLNAFADSVAGVDGMIYQYTKLGGQIDIAIEANNGEIENITAAILQLNRQTDKIKDSLTMTFARLESVTARLQSQQQQLTSILSGLG